MFAARAVVQARWLGEVLMEAVWGSLSWKAALRPGSISGMPYFFLEQPPLRLLFSSLDGDRCTQDFSGQPFGFDLKLFSGCVASSQLLTSLSRSHSSFSGGGGDGFSSQYCPPPGWL